MTKEVKSCGSGVPVPVIGAFAEMSSDVDAPADVIASGLAARHTQFFSTSTLEAGSMYKPRIRAARGHLARRGWARLLIDRRRDLVVHGPRENTRSAGGELDGEKQQRHGGHHYHCPGQFQARISD
jgi:hypothetical protein